MNLRKAFLSLEKNWQQAFKPSFRYVAGEDFVSCLGSAVQSSKGASNSLSEIKEWLRIGFMLENERGQDYRVLTKAIDNITEAFKGKQSIKNVQISKLDLSMLRYTAYQLEYAAMNLMRFETMRSHDAEKYYPGYDFPERAPALFVSWNKGNTSYDIGAAKLNKFLNSFQKFCSDKNIALAGTTESGFYDPQREKPTIEPYIPGYTYIH